MQHQRQESRSEAVPDSLFKVVNTNTFDVPSEGEVTVTT